MILDNVKAHDMSIDRFDIIDDFNSIRKNLFLGSIPKEIGQFKYVFNFVGRPSYYIPIGTMVMVRPFNDAPYIPNEEMLHESAQMVLKFSKLGPTLVHCAAGINRSALIVALALIHDGMAPADAIALIRENRSDMCLSNKTFEDWLLQQKDLPTT